MSAKIERVISTTHQTTPEDFAKREYARNLEAQAQELFGMVEPDGQKVVGSRNGLSMSKEPFSRTDLDILRRADSAGIFRDRPLTTVQVRGEHAVGREYHYIGGSPDDSIWESFANRLKIGKLGKPGDFPVARKWWNK